MFSYEFCKNFKNTLFTELLCKAASAADCSYIKERVKILSIRLLVWDDL